MNWLKLLVGLETERALDKKMVTKADNRFNISMDVIVDTLVEIVNGRKSFKTRRMELLN